MRSRRSGNDQVTEVARRRLELLSAELAELRREPGASDWPQEPSGTAAPGPEPPLVPQPPSDAVPGRHAHRSVGLAGLAAGWLQDRLPPALQGRVQMSAAHVVVVALLAVTGVAVTGWWVSRADGGGTVVPLAPSAASAPAGSIPSGGVVPPLVTPVGTPAGTPTPGAGPGTDPGADPGADLGAGAAVPSPATAGTAVVAVPPAIGSTPSLGAGSIVVDVTGKVRRPGIATLPPGSRVVDALEAAGGARRGARLGALNLARVLVDGEQVVVGVPSPPGLAASAASAPTGPGAASGTGTGAGSPLVNINTASQAELEELPGVGPVTARSILDFRAENGGFTSVDELLEVSGIGDATLADLAPFVTL